jgi:predicted ATP-dependent endonuclease of OLD family
MLINTNGNAFNSYPCRVVLDKALCDKALTICRFHQRLYTLQNTQDVSQQQLTLPLKYIEMIILE